LIPKIEPTLFGFSPDIAGCASVIMVGIPEEQFLELNANFRSEVSRGKIRK
jgi:hypothetical protein